MKMYVQCVVYECEDGFHSKCAVALIVEQQAARHADASLHSLTTFPGYRVLFSTIWSYWS